MMMVVVMMKMMMMMVLMMLLVFVFIHSFLPSFLLFFMSSLLTSCCLSLICSFLVGFVFLFSLLSVVFFSNLPLPPGSFVKDKGGGGRAVGGSYRFEPACSSRPPSVSSSRSGGVPAPTMVVYAPPSAAAGCSAAAAGRFDPNARPRTAADIEAYEVHYAFVATLVAQAGPPRGVACSSTLARRSASPRSLCAGMAHAAACTQRCTCTVCNVAAHHCGVHVSSWWWRWRWRRRRALTFGTKHNRSNTGHPHPARGNGCRPPRWVARL